MATEPVAYLSYTEAVLVHIELMRTLGETRFGVFGRSLVESSLARPMQAAEYGQADIHTQAASLFFGLIKNHPWVGGNKRTASVLTRIFLGRNGHRFTAPVAATIALVHEIQADRKDVPEIAAWLRANTERL